MSSTQFSDRASTLLDSRRASYNSLTPSDVPNNTGVTVSKPLPDVPSSQVGVAISPHDSILQGIGFGAMRLINTTSLEMEVFPGRSKPQYAIVSHTWGAEEVTFDDFQDLDRARSMRGWLKIHNACAKARKDGLNYVWIDTCCIDKSSSAELSEAINSMFAWYREAYVCYAFLEDVPYPYTERPGPDSKTFSKSRWHTRGWTLQELLAPQEVVFYSSSWHRIGTKVELVHELSQITGINEANLLAFGTAPTCAAQKMSWAAGRQTSRIEDTAYCLLGLFGIYMPLLYGEGERAFRRVQEEIIKQSDDESILAWKSNTMFATDDGSFLASSPAQYYGLGGCFITDEPVKDITPSSISNKGLRISLPLVEFDRYWVAILNCRHSDGSAVGIYLKQIAGTSEGIRQFCRTRSYQLYLLDPRTKGVVPAGSTLSQMSREEIFIRIPQEHYKVDSVATLIFDDVPKIACETLGMSSHEQGVLFQRTDHGLHVRLASQAFSRCSGILIFTDGRRRFAVYVEGHHQPSQNQKQTSYHWNSPMELYGHIETQMAAHEDIKSIHEGYLNGDRRTRIRPFKPEETFMTGDGGWAALRVDRSPFDRSVYLASIKLQN
ncbi:heterokaryon incompatibility protein-domain-containing protein [Lineolata rhizophorae]|uniref:Heterokaryon incompatibility protein-domain-containing protein n=1 Tax=Lineolata rhizophorae TaxID=578093 RepID=A0A6A6NLU4_9PEZI|nr:heterokaryon incompatibility protein-domain-containing protein [Lineolata rhizophorae]